MIETNPVIFYLVVGLAAFLVGLAKGGLGGLLGSMATPLVALVVPADVAIGLTLPILMTADPFAVWFHRGNHDRRLILLLLPGALVGVTVGTYLITEVPTETLRTLLAIIILLFVVYKLVEERVLQAIQYEGKDWHSLVAGTIAGFSSSLAHIGGPPISIYLLMRRLKPEAFISTMVLFFFILNWVKVPYYIVARLFNPGLMLRIAPLIPVVLLGVWVGRTFVAKVGGKTFQWVIIGALAIAGIVLLLG